jgi:hypothetical protein
LNKTKKNNKTIFRLLKIILTIVVGLLCFYQFKNLNFKEIKIEESINYSSLLLAFLLVFPNYWMEYKKWDLITKTTDHVVDKQIKIQSFFAGIITGMLTPNMQGNFIGRIYYFQRKFRLPLTLLTLTANLGQFCITISLGIIGLILINNQSPTLIFIPLLILFFAIGFFFYFERIPILNKRFKWYKKIHLLLEKHKSLRLKILWFSFLRNIVFSIQFLFVLHAFGVNIDWKTYWLIWELYLWTTLSPSLIFGKLFVRESIALWVFSAISLSEWSIITASFSIWVINLLFPTLLGLIICKKHTK